MKTSTKHFGLVVGPRPGNMSQNDPKNYFTYDVSHKQSAPPNKKFFFKCNLLDWPIHLNRWTAL